MPILRMIFYSLKAEGKLEMSLLVRSHIYECIAQADAVMTSSGAKVQWCTSGRSPYQRSTVDWASVRSTFQSLDSP